MLRGILAHCNPDIDFIASFWLNTTDNLLAHRRGITHSVLFALFITTVIAWFANKFHRPYNISFPKWILLIGLVVFIHLVLDSFNNYGVSWFESFSHFRISFNTIYVANPFFSIIPGIALLVLIIYETKKYKQKVDLENRINNSFYLLYVFSGK